MGNQYTRKLFVSESHLECSKCHKIKEHSEFHRDSTQTHRYKQAFYCKFCACLNARSNHKLRQETDPEFRLAKKNAYLKYRYGLSLEEYNKRVEVQRVCAICGIGLEAKSPNTHLDHCHKSGKLRQFLCGNCNRGIGSFHDEVWKLRNAIQYLEAHTNSVDIGKEGSSL